MKILVIGGMHGNEPLGLSVVRLFQDKVVEGLDAVYANEQAITNGSRFVTQDLNRSFPGETKSAIYEARRAAELMRLATQYDVVLDFHNTYCPENDCGFVGDTAQQQLYNVAWALGLDKVIVADYDCINKYASNCLSVEISLGSPLNDPELWYERIVTLSRLSSCPAKPKLSKYRFVYRMTIEDKVRLDLPGKGLKAFQPIPKALANAMGAKSPAYPIFVGDGYTPYNYGGLLNKID